MRQHNSCCFLTPFGWCGLVGADAVLQRIFLPEPDRDTLCARMAAQFPGISAEKNCFKEVVREMQRYFKGERPCFDFHLDFAAATVFQKTVWQAARSIAYGQVRTYGWLAVKIGNPRAMRAVGSALASNPFPIIIACHRVIRSDGGMGGFSAVEGIELKQKLLRLEGQSLEGQSL